MIIDADELIERLLRADEDLRRLADAATKTERYRLDGKAQGVRLALSYVRDMTRGQVHK